MARGEALARLHLRSNLPLSGRNVGPSQCQVSESQNGHFPIHARQSGPAQCGNGKEIDTRLSQEGI
ncbi:hypothetical protein PENTCL1PPCAC_4620, partial [Pristionchus entomophagus]